MLRSSANYFAVSSSSSSTRQPSFQSNQLAFSSMGLTAQQIQSSVSLKGHSQAGFAVQAFNSQVEQAVVNSRTQIRVATHNKVQSGSYVGVQHLNRAEETAFHGSIPLSQYSIKKDSNPQVEMLSLCRNTFWLPPKHLCLPPK